MASESELFGYLLALGGLIGVGLCVAGINAVYREYRRWSWERYLARFRGENVTRIRRHD